MKRSLLLTWMFVLAGAPAVGCDDCRSKGSKSPLFGGKPSSGGRPPSAPPETLLDKAIQAAGGVDKLRAASSYHARYRSTSAAGRVEQGEFFYRPGAARLRLTTSGGEHYDLLTSQKGCARVYDPVVVPCTPSRAERAKRYHLAYEASWLWPLQTDRWSVKASTAMVGDTSFDVLLPRKKGHDVEAMLYLDPETQWITRVSVSFDPKNNAQNRLSVRSEFEDVCGAKVPLREEAYLDNKPSFTVELSNVRCGGVAPATVAIPKQVADGTIERRTLAARTMLCHMKSAPYARVGELFEGLDRQLEKRRLLRQREVGWVIFAAQPKPDQPLPNVARGCVEVVGKPPDEPQRQGPFELSRLPAQEVLSAFGAGPYDELVTRLAELLYAEAERRQIDPAGEIRQLGYMVAKDAPERDRITELQLVLPASPAE